MQHQQAQPTPDSWCRVQGQLDSTNLPRSCCNVDCTRSSSEIATSPGFQGLRPDTTPSETYGPMLVRHHLSGSGRIFQCLVSSPLFVPALWIQAAPYSTLADVVGLCHQPLGEE